MINALAAWTCVKICTSAGIQTFGTGLATRLCRYGHRQAQSLFQALVTGPHRAFWRRCMRRSVESPRGRQCITSSGGVSQRLLDASCRSGLLQKWVSTEGATFPGVSREMPPMLEAATAHTKYLSSAAMQASSTWEQCCGCWHSKMRTPSGR